MSSSGFDIASLLRFAPARYHCERCLALWVSTPLPSWERANIVCPTCNATYLPSEEFSIGELSKYLTRKSLAITFDDVIGHSRKLAAIATKARTYLSEPDGSYHRRYNAYTPMRALLDMLLHAQKFVHFVTFGCSPVLMGAIKMTAQRVPVRGIVSNASESVKEELITYKDESPYLDVRLFGRSDRRQDWQSAPHQKLIVIDGLILFKGAANLTTDGWRKAARRLDVIEIVTNVEEVISFHNNYFSPVWAASSEEKQDEIAMMFDDIPF